MRIKVSTRKALTTEGVHRAREGRLLHPGVHTVLRTCLPSHCQPDTIFLASSLLGGRASPEVSGEYLLSKKLECGDIRTGSLQDEVLDFVHPSSCFVVAGG